MSQAIEYTKFGVASFHRAYRHGGKAEEIAVDTSAMKSAPKYPVVAQVPSLFALDTDSLESQEILGLVRDKLVEAWPSLDPATFAVHSFVSLDGTRAELLSVTGAITFKAKSRSWQLIGFEGFVIDTENETFIQAIKLREPVYSHGKRIREFVAADGMVGGY